MATRGEGPPNDDDDGPSLSYELDVNFFFFFNSNALSFASCFEIMPSTSDCFRRFVWCWQTVAGSSLVNDEASSPLSLTLVQSVAYFWESCEYVYNKRKNNVFSNQVGLKYASSIVSEASTVLAWMWVHTTYRYNTICSGTAWADFPKLCGRRWSASRN